MLVGISADLHLTSLKNHPERYHALQDILNSCLKSDIEYLIIAGDLFDKSMQNYAEFERICNTTKYQNIKIIIIPGNHDTRLQQSDIVAGNVTIISESRFMPIFSREPNFLFIPYKNGSSMGKEILKFNKALKPGKWNLVGHGDWAANLNDYNPYEPGVYMPLSKVDINLYQPENIFLGHIHTPIDNETVHYPGSPCGIDITEVGYRRFLLYDVEKKIITEQKINTDIIFFDETFTIFPVEDEAVLLKRNIQNRIRSWNLNTSDLKKVVVRVKIQGYTTDRSRIADIVDREFGAFRYYDQSQPDLTNLSTSISPDRDYISKKIIETISNLDFQDQPNFPKKEEIILAALKTIYEV